MSELTYSIKLTLAEVELLSHACKHIIDYYDQDIQRHQTYNKATSNSEETKAVIQHHIENDINMVGYYQRIKEMLDDATTTNSNIS